MPPPEPRSSTVCPGSNASRAVGLPHPRDAATASAGSPSVSASEYKSAVMGSPHPQEEGPQHPVVPTDFAIAPYFSCTAV